MKLHRYVDHQRLHILTKDVISLSISVLLLFTHYISRKITFGAPSSGGVLCSACGAFIIELKFCESDFYFLNGRKKCKVATYNFESVYTWHLGPSLFNVGSYMRGWTGGYPIPSSLPLSPHFPPPSPPLPSPYYPTSLPLLPHFPPPIRFFPPPDKILFLSKN